MADIKISVVMSVYNTSETYLKEAIESILNQSLPDFEFIIINDASNRATSAILNQYTDERIVRIENQQNLGITASLNEGLEIARGRYIARMDADDVSFPERLSKQYQYMEKHPHIAVLGCWTTTNGKINKYQ